MSGTMDRNGKQHKGRKLNKSKIIFRLVVPVLIILTTLICYFVSYRYILKSTSGEAEEASIKIAEGTGIDVNIPLGSGTASIANILGEKGLIKHPTLFKLISKVNGYDGSYQSGIHRLSAELSYTEIMRVLSDKPDVEPSIKVTIPEGLTQNQIMDKLNKDAEKSEITNFVDKNKFAGIVESGKFDYKFINDIPAGREFRLQGYLFPETYFFDIDGGEEEIINKMLGQFDKIFTEERYKRAKELNMTLDQVITLASLVERESSVSEERPLIAGVFYNRLKSKDASLRRLQSCASIQYIFLQKTGEIKTRILTEDTKVKDPYNTYIHEGLPPGPICSPGEDAIDAVLYPEESDYMYFVAKDDGSKSHYFSKTFKEHLNAQAKAQKNQKAKGQ